MVEYKIVYLHEAENSDYFRLNYTSWGCTLVTPFHTDHVGGTLDMIPDMLTYMCGVCLPGVNQEAAWCEYVSNAFVMAAWLYDCSWIMWCLQ